MVLPAAPTSITFLGSKAKGLHGQEPMVGWPSGCVAGAKVGGAR